MKDPDVNMEPIPRDECHDGYAYDLALVPEKDCPDNFPVQLSGFFSESKCKFYTVRTRVVVSEPETRLARQVVHACDLFCQDYWHYQVFADHKFGGFAIPYREKKHITYYSEGERTKVDDGYFEELVKGLNEKKPAPELKLSIVFKPEPGDFLNLEEEDDSEPSFSGSLQF